MPNTLLQEKAEKLRSKAESVGQAMQSIDNTELDLAPEAHRVVVCGALLPGFRNGTFSGQAEFCGQGQILSLGVRHQGCGECRDLMVRREGGDIRVTERCYFEGHSVTLTVHAVFNSSHQVLHYEELF
jgi:hypothetical protein